MGKKVVTDKYLPLTHTTYYILLAMVSPLHGYGIMQKVEAMSQGEVILGPGTLYGALSKLEKQQLIERMAEEDRRKSYMLTRLGRDVMIAEYDRIQRLLKNSQPIINQAKWEEES